MTDIDSPGGWSIVAQVANEEAASAFVADITSGSERLPFGEWEIVVREDKRRARSGGAFVVWARRVDQGAVDGRPPAGRWVRAVRAWTLASGVRMTAESPEDPAGESIRGMPPRIVDEELRRQLIDRLPRRFRVPDPIGPLAGSMERA